MADEKVVSYQNLSRQGYGVIGGRPVHPEELSTGAMLRIAAALERIDKRLQQLRTPEELRQAETQAREDAREQELVARVRAAMSVMSAPLPRAIRRHMLPWWFVVANPNGDPINPADWRPVWESREIRGLGKVQQQALREWAEACAAQRSASAAGTSGGEGGGA